MSDYDRFEKIFSGTWRHDRVENLEAYLDAKETPAEARKWYDMYNDSVLTYARTGSKIKLTHEFGPRTFEAAAAFGEEYEFKDNPDDPKIHTKTTSTMKGDTIHQDVFHVKRGIRNSNVVSVEGDELISTATYKGVSMRRIYRRA